MHMCVCFIRRPVGAGWVRDGYRIQRLMLLHLGVPWKLVPARMCSKKCLACTAPRVLSCAYAEHGNIHTDIRVHAYICMYTYGNARMRVRMRLDVLRSPRTCGYTFCVANMPTLLKHHVTPF
jgi:hypothetical protein